MIRRFGVRDDAIQRSLTQDIEKALEDADQLPVVELLGTLLAHRKLEIQIVAGSLGGAHGTVC